LETDWPPHSGIEIRQDSQPGAAGFEPPHSGIEIRQDSSLGAAGSEHNGRQPKSGYRIMVADRSDQADAKSHHVLGVLIQVVSWQRAPKYRAEPNAAQGQHEYDAL
jgi:hypothetical protein